MLLPCDMLEDVPARTDHSRCQPDQRQVSQVQQRRQRPRRQQSGQDEDKLATILTEDTSSDEDDMDLVRVQFRPGITSRLTGHNVGQYGGTKDDLAETTVHGGDQTVEEECRDQSFVPDGDNAAEVEVLEEVTVQDSDNIDSVREFIVEDRNITEDSMGHDNEVELLQDAIEMDHEEHDDRVGENRLPEIPVRRSGRTKQQPPSFMYYKLGGDPIVTQRHNDGSANIHVDAVG